MVIRSSTVETANLTASVHSKSGLGEPARQRAWRWLKPSLGLLVSGFFVWLAFHSLPMDSLAAALENVSWGMLPLAVVALAVGYAFRIVRWRAMLVPSAPEVTIGETARHFLVSIALNNVLPLRLGDIMRVFAFRGRPGLEASRVAGTMLAERLLDLFAVLAVLFVAAQFAPANAGVEAISRYVVWIAAAGLAALGLLGLIASRGDWVLERLEGRDFGRAAVLITRLTSIVAMLAGTLRMLGHPRRLSLLVAYTAIVWTCEGAVYFVSALATSTPLPFAGASLALAVATLSTLIPSSPGYVGTFHYFAMQVAIAFGAAPAKAAAYAIITHLLLWLPTTAAGLGIFLATSIGAPKGQPVAKPAYREEGS